MADCTKLTKCPFFRDKLDNAPATAALLKVKFCRGEFAKCARFLVSAKLGPAGVPLDLFPHQSDRAKLLIGE